jgi:hypothetical protein
MVDSLQRYTKVCDLDIIVHELELYVLFYLWLGVCVCVMHKII